ncbi:PhnD/SsuA/transferrin family substrate-binding protein [Rhodovulum steppense]|uniref:Phosphonate transport system substrate-binding protein n=1 Tax=Rhodovulum steppense TaxID=540251 RepID=A0A4R1Z0M2_9RHOB|nr:PhnD/SsuA/transferrin family substrate-binding protein [Rhodovulum steppense]TCM87122.1 phosphonate transport system substrate-binding protein [Rhodovulum steppense]
MTGAVLSRRRLTAGLAAALALAGPARPQGIVERAAPLRIGLTPVFLDNEWRVLEALAAHVRGVTGREVEFVQRRTYKEVVALLLLGELDAAWLCGYPFLQHADRLSVLAIPLWQGQPRYQSYLITAENRRASGLADLRGDIHAYSDPDSNSGHLVTVAELIRLGERPEAFFARSFFTFGHRNVVRAVARRLAGSGSVDGYVYDTLAETEPDLVARTRILWRSDWHGFPPIVIPSEASDSPAARALDRALFGMAGTGPGRDVLRLLQLDGFARPAPDSFDSIAALMARVADRG